MHPDEREVRTKLCRRRDDARLCHIASERARDGNDWIAAKRQAEAGVRHLKGMCGSRAEELRRLLRVDLQRADDHLGIYANGRMGVSHRDCHA